VHAAEDVVEELGVEALHAAGDVWVCAGAGSVILYVERTQKYNSYIKE
jgi:hypothetical protein